MYDVSLDIALRAATPVGWLLTTAVRPDAVAADYGRTLSLIAAMHACVLLLLEYH